MAVGRIADQAALGIAGLVLAARLSVESYAAVALVLVGHSVGATLSDLGLAHELLRLGPGERAALRYLRAVRVVNVACLAIAGLLWATVGPVSALVVALWAANSEAMLRQSTAMLDNDHRRLGIAQMVAAAVLLTLVVALVHDAEALGLAIAARVAVELVALRPSGRWFSAGHDARRDLQPLRVLVTHSIGFGNRNVDFLIGAPFLGAAGFARYVFAYRLANAGFAPVGTIATRLGISELAGGGEELASRYRRGTTALFVGGTAAAVVTALGALAVPWLVGDRWAGAVALILLLTVALPFRFIDGVISPLLYVSANHDNAIALELVRLAVIVAAVVVGAALGGVTGLAVAMSAATIVSVVAGHRWAAKKAGIAGPAWLDSAAAVALLVLGIGALL
jgi:O-antigen/teichoic acid export membrane protein